MSRSFHSGAKVESALGVKKTIEILKTTRCEVELLKVDLELRLKASRGGLKSSVA